MKEGKIVFSRITKTMDILIIDIDDCDNQKHIIQ